MIYFPMKPPLVLTKRLDPLSRQLIKLAAAGSRLVLPLKRICAGDSLEREGAQGSAERRAPGCVSGAGKDRQK